MWEKRTLYKIYFIVNSSECEVTVAIASSVIQRVHTGKSFSHIGFRQSINWRGSASSSSHHVSMMKRWRIVSLNWKKSSESFLNEEGVCSRLYISNDIHDPDQRRRNTIRFYFLIRYSGPPAIPNLNPRRLRSVSVVRYIYIQMLCLFFSLRFPAKFLAKFQAH